MIKITTVICRNEYTKYYIYMGIYRYEPIISHIFSPLSPLCLDKTDSTGGGRRGGGGEHVPDGSRGGSRAKWFKTRSPSPDLQDLCPARSSPRLKMSFIETVSVVSSTLHTTFAPTLYSAWSEQWTCASNVLAYW